MPRKCRRRQSAYCRGSTLQRKGPYNFLPLREKKVTPSKAAGISHAQLSEPQWQRLMALVQVYLDNMDNALDTQRRREIEEAGVHRITFGWSGAAEQKRNHYYRIQGPTFIVEYDNRDGGDHIHSVWRDFDGDFGEDLLLLHLQHHH